jgi:hypothetical protein
MKQEKTRLRTEKPRTLEPEDHSGSPGILFYQYLALRLFQSANEMRHKDSFFSKRKAPSPQRGAASPKISANPMIQNSLSEIGFVCSKRDFAPATRTAAALYWARTGRPRPRRSSGAPIQPSPIWA